MDSSVRLPMITRKDYIKQLADIYLHESKHRFWEGNKPYLAARLCSEYCDAIDYLTELESISFMGTTFNVLALLVERLPKLRTLDLDTTRIHDLNPLTQLQNLVFLYLSNTAITNLSLLTQMHELQWLMLINTAVTDLNPLAQLQNLQKLYLNNTIITDLSPLSNLTNLQELHITEVKANADVLKKQLPNLKIIQ